MPATVFTVADPALPTLETQSSASESPRLASAALVEADDRLLAHRVRPASVSSVSLVAGFLDGVQRSRVVGYVANIPLVFGEVAAVIRRRVERRLMTYEAPVCYRRLYVPCQHLPAAAREALTGAVAGDGIEIRDTSDGQRTDVGVSHPDAWSERAVQYVQHDRERAEVELAERWCRAVEGQVPVQCLYADGGIGTSERIAASAAMVGVVKSHRTLYVDAQGLSVVMNLEVGERTTVFRIASSHRPPVLSWYLRVRVPHGRGPMWGLVRVEMSDGSLAHVSARADALSRSVMAEHVAPAPISLPDRRWDTLAYGIHDCEQFLRSIL